MSGDWISINLNATSLEKGERYLKAFGKLAVPGIQRAMNRSLKGVRTDAIPAIRDVYNVKAGVVRSSFTLYRAGGGGSAHGGMHGGRLQASAVSRGSRISMMAFSPRPSTASRKRMPKVGASAMVQKGVRKTIPGAFVGTSRAGLLRMYVREGKVRDRLRVISGPSVPQMLGAMNHPEIYDRIRENAKQRYEKNLDHEMDRLLKRLGVRA
jgi:hypothetical protein